jgi:hypothetical protein
MTLPADALDNGPTICLSKLLLKMDCPGCGMTRAVMHAIHFDFNGAWGFNKLVIIVLPIIIYLFCKEVIRLINKIFNLNLLN